ncbi:MAG: hypothetical protein AAGH67_04195 [Cyanobacteria bacterium P01_H01_bin.162]
MTDEDYRNTFQQLISFLNDHSLPNYRQMGWVIDEVNEVLRAGKLIDEPIENASKRTSREFRTTREYTPQEALLILIDSIESAIVHAAFMEKEVTNFFRKEGQEFDIPPEVRFLGEGEPQPMVFSYDSAINREKHAIRLEKLLKQLRSEVQG